MVAQVPLWQYLIIFTLGGLSALVVLRLVYGSRKVFPQLVQQDLPLQVKALVNEQTYTIVSHNKLIQCISRQTLLPKELRIWYRRLNLALGVDHVIVPRVKLSRLITIKNKEDINLELSKTLRTTGVDFAICANNTLKVLAVVRLCDQNKIDDISDLLKQSSIPEVQLLLTKEYSTSELRGIFLTKLLPPTARTLPIAV